MHTTDTTDLRLELPQRRATLCVLYSGAAGVRQGAPIPLRAGAYSIGREAPAQGLAIPLPEDRRLSRLHATIHVDAAGAAIHVVDGGSKNGTFVNGARVTEAPLREGDLLRVGDSFLLLRYQPTQPPLPGSDEAGGLRGTSPAMSALRASVHLAAKSGATVLLCGESGTGKEVTARALHELSGLSGPLVAVNCSAIPAELAESQLFGHGAGAFTGAKAAHPGFFRAAHGGTLLLDELGELVPAIQPKLLRALEEKAVVPVGAVVPVPCAPRVVAATNRDLLGAIAAGAFRGDLHARLAEVVITLPPLRERREDVLPLLLLALGEPVPRLAPLLVEALLLYPWPFNVRELFKIAVQLRLHVPRCAVLDLDLVADRLQRPVEAAPAPAPPQAPTATGRSPRSLVPDRETLDGLLREARGNLSQVARTVGRSRMQVERWMASYGLDLKSYRA